MSNPIPNSRAASCSLLGPRRASRRDAAKIAQHFSAGLTAPSTNECRRHGWSSGGSRFSRPSGTEIHSCQTRDPALKCWAIFILPLTGQRRLLWGVTQSPGTSNPTSQTAPFAICLFLACISFIVSPANACAQDQIICNDTGSKNERRVAGTIETESPSAIVIKPTGKAKSISIPAADVVDVIYQVTPLARLEYRAATNREAAASKAVTADERRRELTAALGRYEQLLPMLTEEKSKRHGEFKIAEFHALLARNHSQLDLAIEQLRRFKNTNPSGWQITRSANLLGALLEERHDWDGARKTYEDLRATADLPAEARQECDLKIAQVSLRPGKLAQAERSLADLAKSVSPDSPLGCRIRISMAECRALAGHADEAVPSLESLVSRVTDPELKARVYNALGDCHRRAKNLREALWDYLWVDTLYHQNPEEHARALYYLFQLFHQFNDEARAAQFRDRLTTDPRFLGLEFQRRLLSEK
jgi:tetratricopeptide (TPR) repeat protein